VSVTKLGAETMRREPRGYRSGMGIKAMDSAASGTEQASSNRVQPLRRSSSTPAREPIFIVVLPGCDSSVSIGTSRARGSAVHRSALVAREGVGPSLLSVFHYLGLAFFVLGVHL
jgi:hypothetical protein